MIGFRQRERGVWIDPTKQQQKTTRTRKNLPSNKNKNISPILSSLFLSFFSSTSPFYQRTHVGVTGGLLPTHFLFLLLLSLWGQVPSCFDSFFCFWKKYVYYTNVTISRTVYVVSKGWCVRGTTAANKDHKNNNQGVSECWLVTVVFGETFFFSKIINDE